MLRPDEVGHRLDELFDASVLGLDASALRIDSSGETVRCLRGVATDGDRLVALLGEVRDVRLDEPAREGAEATDRPDEEREELRIHTLRGRREAGCGCRIRTGDLRGMSPARYLCANPL